MSCVASMAKTREEEDADMCADCWGLKPIEGAVWYPDDGELCACK